MTKILVAFLCMLTLSAQAQYERMGRYADKSPEDQEALRQIGESLQSVQMGVMQLSQNASKLDLAKQKKTAELIKKMDANLKKYADPSGLQAAMLGLMMTMQTTQMHLQRVSGEDLRALADSLKAIDKDLGEVVGPENLRKARSARKEGGAKGNLGAIRSALSIYYGDKEGKYPAAVRELIPKYLARIPELELPEHKPSDGIRVLKSVGSMEELKNQLTDSGQWTFVLDPDSKIDGTVLIDCTHKDSRGSQWHAY
ncbi:MAG: hypothetical protein M0D55_19420 [Elusimicrobiota bacterium]|nr:MAG: hypothetical protein M0D55_19420 [Elusimicrobiota bacterium]